jgi:sulfate permease, SulP family
MGGKADSSRYVALAAALAVVMGLLLFLAGVLRLGFVADFFGKPVLLGYINGVALIVIASQLGIGIGVGSRDFFPILREVVGKLADANAATVVVSAVVLLTLAIGVKRVLPAIPSHSSCSRRVS